MNPVYGQYLRNEGIDVLNTYVEKAKSDAAKVFFDNLSG